MNAEIKPIYIRLADAPKMFGISRTALYRMRDRGEIVFHKRGKTALLKVEDMVRAIEGSEAS